MTKLSSEQKKELIVRNLQEVLGEDRINEILATRDLKIYWGTATTGKPHIAYFVPMLKIADFLKADCEVTILLANLHGYLDNMKAPWDLLELRTQYYEEIIKAMMLSINVSIEKLKFVRGTDYQLTEKYSLDVYKLASTVTEHDAKKAGAEVVKQVDHPLLSSLLYPGLQALDEEYLNCDAQFGGVDQRKIFTFAEKYLPLLGYKKRAHLMNPMIPGLSGGKMSSSEVDSKIDLLDSSADVKKKLKRVFCEPGNLTDNGLLAFVKHVIFGIIPAEQGFVVNRKPDDGGNIVFFNYNDLESNFCELLLHPADLKAAVAIYVDNLLAPIRKTFESDRLKKLTAKAYPVPGQKVALETGPQLLDLKIGKITGAEKVNEDDKLWTISVLINDENTLSVVSNVDVCMNDFIDKFGIVLCNMKPSKFKGIMSSGILLCSAGDIKSPIIVNNDYKPGQQLMFEEFPIAKDIAILNPKKKIWEKLQADLCLNESGELLWQNSCLQTEHGEHIKCNAKNCKIV